MKRSPAVHDTLVYRLSQILIKLNQGDLLDPQSLSEQFGVSLRTIQRDLSVRFACLPLLKSGKRYHLDQHYLGKLTIKDIQKFALLSGVSQLFPQQTDRFLREVFLAGTSDAWMVKGHHYEDISGRNELFVGLERAIIGRHHVQFTYNKTVGQSKRHQQVEPYKLLNNKGIWYLAAWDDDHLKSFSVTKIADLYTESTTFLPRKNIDSELTSNDSIWLGAPRVRLVLRVGAHVAPYFKRRQLIANQVIETEFENGDLLISTTAAHANEILPTSPLLVAACADCRTVRLPGPARSGTCRLFGSTPQINVRQSYTRTEYDTTCHACPISWRFMSRKGINHVLGRYSTYRLVVFRICVR